MSRTSTLSPDCDQRFGVAMADLIAPRWRRVWAELDRLGGDDDVEAIHDIRVASRRLRAAMDIAADCFPPGWYAPLHRTARDITASLGDVRDRDVMLLALEAERAAAPPEDHPAIDVLIEQVRRERTRAQREMRAFLAVLEASGARDASARRFPVRDAEKGATR